MLNEDKNLQVVLNVKFAVGDSVLALEEIGQDTIGKVVGYKIDKSDLVFPDMNYKVGEVEYICNFDGFDWTFLAEELQLVE